MNTAVSVPMDFIKSGVAEVSVLFTLSVSAINPLPNDPVEVDDPLILEFANVNIDRTDDNVYGESTTKYYDIGFRVYCLILYNEPEIVQEL